MSRSEQLRSLVAHGWTAMFLVFLANLVMDLVRVTIEGSAAPWAAHMGMQGVKFILAIMAVYAAMPVLVRTFSARWFRYAMVGLTVFMSLFVGAHEASHLVAADKPFGLLHTLDLMHHVLGIWVAVAAVMWARHAD